jgi:hypothetical protein
MRALKIFILLALSFVDLRVDAKDIVTLTNARKLVQEPENCIENAVVCALQTSDAEKFKLKLESAVVILNEKTAIVRQSESSFTLLSGSVWIKANSEVLIKSEYGSVKSQAGQFWVTHEAKKLIVESIDSQLVLKPRLGSSDLSLSPGEQNWLGPIDETSLTSSGIPLPIDAQKLLFRWAKIYPGTKSSFEAEFKNFLKLWRSAVEKLAEHHSAIANRRLASISQANAKIASQKREHDLEDQRIRKWFRDRELSN